MTRTHHVGAGMLLAGILTVGAAPAQAAIIPIELVLAIDASGSMSNAEYDLQKNAYASVLSSDLIPTDGTMAIGVLQFARSLQTIFTLTVIDSQQTKDALVAAVNGMNRLGIDTGATAIGNAITQAQMWLGELSFANDNQVIDVSTDGANNFGTNPVSAANAALAAGTTTNCLGVGPGANCSFETGFELLVADFADFGDALEQKLRQETGQTPEPVTLALFGLGLLGLGLARRRA